MKKARAADYWRALDKRKEKGPVASLSGLDIRNFPAAPITMPGAITVITGLNGVGKSTLIHAAHLALQRGSDVVIKNSALRASTGELTCKIVKSSGSVTAQVTLTPEGCTQKPDELPIQVVWIDPGFEIPKLIEAFRNGKNLDEAIRQVEPKEFTKDEVASLSRLVGKDYEKCAAYELEGFADRDVCPYFRVRAHFQEYGTEAMGLGEASIHYTNWALSRIQPESVILLEEPETYVSARSQAALMDRLAEVCVKQNCSAIVTTHSPHVFESVPPRHTLILVRDGDAINAVVKESERARLMALAVPPHYQKQGFLLVEDRVARAIAVSWLSRSDPELLVRWRLVDQGSTGEVLGGLQHFPDAKEWFGAVGLLDGDERIKGHTSARPLCFLPGDCAPEILLRHAIRSSPGLIADKLDLDRELFRIAVGSVEGMEHHDWLIELAKASNVAFDKLVDAAFEVWAADEENAALCARSLSELRMAITP
ncbi:MAG: hypothetical protein IT365_24155 [Candidatus Hydrogenedentes bacterium]|nr:hypothetical protein [Candidatus Hydrogenedentota bacterium]